MKIEVIPDKEKKPQPSLEERIVSIANNWAETLLNDTGDNFIIDGLTESLNNKIVEQLGIRMRHSSWDGYGIEVDLYADRPLARMIRDFADKEVKRIINEITFEPVVLSERELNAIKRAYNTRIKEQAIEAARDLAEQQAINLAKAALGIEDDGEEE